MSDPIITPQDHVTLVLRAAEGQTLESVLPFLALGAPVAIGRGLALIAEVANGNTIEEKRLATAAATGYIGAVDRYMQAAESLEQSLERLNALDERFTDEGWQSELTVELLDMLLEAYEAANRAGVITTRDLASAGIPAQMKAVAAEAVVATWNPPASPDTPPTGLLPCPFCGGTEAFVERLDYTSAYVQCDSKDSDGCCCMARGPVAIQESDEEELPGGAGAIANWNQRAAAQVPEEVARLLDWAVGRWEAEVKHRPLVNVHRRSLDDTWRQIIRRLGGNPVALCGLDHDALSAQSNEREVQS